MSVVDNRIVNMKLDNSQFISAVRTTIEALKKMEGAFGFKSSKKNLQDVQNQVNSFSGQPMDDQVGKITKSFVALSTIAITALSNITNRVVDAGIKMGKSLTLDPIMQGFGEYELKMGSIQTILANTQRHGTTLAEVSDNLDKLNTYADKTIYNFGDMTRNIGLFTNAGIKIEDATSMIQGFSNVAAASGTSSQGAAGAAYQLSQALSAGTIRLMDWRSLTNVGMGNKNMQDGIIQIADAMGAFEGTAITAKQAGEDFNGSLEEKWLSADIMENYLKIMAGEVTPAQMQAMGLTQQQIDMFVEQQKTAEEAATKVRTWTQLVGTVQEAIGSGWAETFTLIFGDFDEATELFTGISNAIGGFVGKSADARNQILEDWKVLGGRTELIEALKNVFTGLGKILETIKNAFRDVFPPMFGGKLLDITRNFRDFTESLIPGEETLQLLSRTFRGIFSALSIGWEIIKGVASIFSKLFGSIFKGSGGFLKITATIGDFIYSISNALKEGNKLSNFFDKLGDILIVPTEILGVLVSVIGSTFSSALGGASDAVDAMGNSISPVGGLVEGVAASFENLGGVLKNVKKFFEPIIEFFGEMGSGIFESFANAFSGQGLSNVLSGLNVGVLGFLGVMINKLVTNGIGVDFGGKFFSGISDSLEGLSGVLQGMQANLKANALLKIAGAIGIIALALVLLAGIDPAKLTAAIAAMSASFAVLIGGLGAMSKVVKPSDVAKIAALSGILVALAVAILILAGAIKLLSTLSWEELAKGLVGIAGAMVVLVLAMKPLESKHKKMMRTAAAMVLLAISIRILASAVARMAELSLGEIIKGVGGIAAALVVLIAAMKKMPKGMVKNSTGLLILAIALNVLASAVEKFAAMPMGDIAQGLGAIGAALVVISIAMKLMPNNMIVTAAGLVLVGIALGYISDALANFGSMSWEELAKGLGALAASMIILGISLIFMSGTLAGAAALVVAAAAIALLVPSLWALAQLSIGQIAAALVTLAAVFLILGAAGYFLAPFVPVLLGLGAAILLIGAGALLAGLGAMAFAQAIKILMEAVSVSYETMDMIFHNLIDMIPEFIRAIGEGFVAFIEVIANSHEAFVGAFVSIFGAILDAAIELVPKFVELLGVMLDGAITLGYEYIPKFVILGFDLLTGFMLEIRRRMPYLIPLGVDIIVELIKGLAKGRARITRAAVDSIIAFIKQIGYEGQRLIQAGWDMIIDFIDGLAKSIDRNMPRLRTAMRNLGTAMMDGLTGGLWSKAGNVISAIGGVVGRGISFAKSLLGINSPSKVFMDIGESVGEGMAKGIDENAKLVGDASENVGKTAVDRMQRAMKNVYDELPKNVETHPVITPVLDLTQVKRESGKISKLVASNKISAETSFTQAKVIARDSKIAETERATQEEAQTKANIEFVQNNYSPKALSAIDIYRNTRNQLSLAKEAMSV